uniref:Uncharacterized protein n=1 Tax=Amphilophus citrinellus TaxID=61819 RepID=A0A3Q0RBF4_AMPCI
MGSPLQCPRVDLPGEAEECDFHVVGASLNSFPYPCHKESPQHIWMTLHNRGCLSSSLCNQTVSGSLLGANYTITRDCCYTDLCNGASSVQLPLTAALGTALAASLSPWAL